MSIKRVTEVLSIDSSSITADESGEALNILHQEMWSAQIIWTSTTAAATVQIEESNDGSTWSTISGKTQAISSDSGNVMLSGSNQASKFIRVTVDHTSGTITTLTVKMIAKG